ncbi:hypothetical protein ACFL67_00120 [candidate division KSB1 bacterium]
MPISGALKSSFPDPNFSLAPFHYDVQYRYVLLALISLIYSAYFLYKIFRQSNTIEDIFRFDKITEMLGHSTASHVIHTNIIHSATGLFYYRMMKFSGQSRITERLQSRCISSQTAQVI